MHACKNKPTELFRTSNGIISYSERNETFIVQFSNLLIRLEPSGYGSFHEFVHVLDIDSCENICPLTRCFVLKMPTNINFVFNKVEIQELRELTTTALGVHETLMEAKQLFYTS